MTTFSARIFTVLAAVAVGGGVAVATAQAASAAVLVDCANQGVPVYADSVTSYSPDCGTGYRVHAYTKRLRWDSYSGGNPAKSARMQSYVRFERTNGDGRDARDTRVTCRDNYGGQGSDGEDKATKTTVTYSTPGIPPGAAVTVTCEHKATYNGVTYSTSTVQTMYAPYL